MSHTRAVLQTGDNSGVTSECVALHVEASKFVGCHIIAYIFVCVLHCKFLKAIKTIHFLITFMVGSQTSTDSIKRNSRGTQEDSRGTPLSRQVQVLVTQGLCAENTG